VCTNTTSAAAGEDVKPAQKREIEMRSMKTALEHALHIPEVQNPELI